MYYTVHKWSSRSSMKNDIFKDSHEQKYIAIKPKSANRPIDIHASPHDILFDLISYKVMDADGRRRQCFINFATPGAKRRLGIPHIMNIERSSTADGRWWTGNFTWECEERQIFWWCFGLLWRPIWGQRRALQETKPESLFSIPSIWSTWEVLHSWVDLYLKKLLSWLDNKYLEIPRKKVDGQCIHMSC